MYNRRRGIMMQLLSTSIPLSSLPQGSLIGIAESGVIKPFLLAKTNYESSGRTLLLRKYLISNKVWNSSNLNTYASSTINTWLNGTYLALLDAAVQAQIAAVKIPYTPGNFSMSVGSLSRKVFLLSGTEVGCSGVSYMNTEGADLGLFANNASRIAYLESAQTTAAYWWLRSPYTNNTSAAMGIDTGGECGRNTVTINSGARPAFTLPDSLPVNSTPTAEGYYIPIV